VFNLLLGHGGHHVAQIKQIASNDFRNEAATWHAMRKHMLVISDAIAGALVKQFPERFEEPHELTGQNVSRRSCVVTDRDRAPAVTSPPSS
jgi:hypothetical protein